MSGTRSLLLVSKKRGIVHRFTCFQVDPAYARPWGPGDDHKGYCDHCLDGKPPTLGE